MHFYNNFFSKLTKPLCGQDECIEFIYMSFEFLCQIRQDPRFDINNEKCTLEKHIKGFVGTILGAKVYVIKPGQIISKCVFINKKGKAFDLPLII